MDKGSNSIISARKGKRKTIKILKPALKDAIVVPDFAGDRYSALKLIPWWQQDKISGARIMVVGAGALGNEVLKNLALLGIGHIFIVDFDDIEASNLSRSVLFRPGDSGKSKAESAACKIKELNQDVSVAFHNGNVITDIGLGIFRRMDLVIGCVDNIEARLFINEACWSLDKPWINGGIEAMQGVVDVFVPPDGPCYECTMTDLDYSEMNRRHPCGLPPEQVNEGKIPTTPTIASIIAGVMVQEAMKIIHGKEVQSGTGWFFFGLTNNTMRVAYPYLPDCLSHHRLGPGIIEVKRSVADITVKELYDECNRLLGGPATINLGFDLVLSATCGCGQKTQLLIRKDLLKREHVTCKNCGEVMSTEVTGSIFKMDDLLMGRRLSELGVAFMPIIAANKGDKSVYVELTGDEARAINYI